jgi:hypothetical protein
MNISRKKEKKKRPMCLKKKKGKSHEKRKRIPVNPGNGMRRKEDAH